MSFEVYVSIGSNLGDRFNYCRRAIELLRAAGGLEVFAVSSAYLTEPVGYLDQPDFVNLVVGLRTKLEVYQVYRHCKFIEAELGRVSTIRWGPRVVDLDLLLFGDDVIDLSDLTVPHPRMHERRFVLEPLIEIAPDAYHPVLRKTAAEMLSALDEQGGKIKGRICWIDPQIQPRPRCENRTKTA